MMEDKKLPVFAVSGEKETGKTTLATKVIEKLTSKGYEVASIKHTKGEYTIDQENTDTWKHSQAGSGLVVFSTPVETSFVFKDHLELEDIVRKISVFGDYDILIIEGMKEENIPHIVLENTVPDADVVSEDKLIEIIDIIEREIGIYSIYNKLPMKDCRKCGYEDCRKFAEAVFEGEKELNSCVEKEEKETIQIAVNGNKIHLSGFPSNIVENGIKGMLSSLKGVDDVDEINEVDIHLEGE